jgi:endogenous inhibitor of DNA gyrase (YacG/DUF329 family)
MHIRDCASADNGKADRIIHEIEGELRERASRVLSDSMGKSAIVKCATCGRKTEFFAEPVGHFCSNRCQMIDLGKWLTRNTELRSRPS